MSDRAVIRDSMLLPGGGSRNAVSSTYVRSIVGHSTK